MKLRRMTTGLIMFAAMVALWCVQGPVLRIALMLLNCVCVWEVYGALSAKGMRPARWVGMLYAMLTLPVYLLSGMVMITPLTTLFCMLGLAVVLFRGEPDFEAAVGTLFPIFYPGLMFTMVYPLQDLANSAVSSIAVGLAILIPACSDTAAYFVGSKWGKRKLTPKLSPQKTVEGAAAGWVAAMLVSFLTPAFFRMICAWYEPWKAFAEAIPPLWTFLPLGFVAGVASMFGDLAASMVKRYCGVKDYGHILPGHGGFMDRMDSVLFNGVVLYVFFLLVR